MLKSETIFYQYERKKLFTWDRIFLALILGLTSFLTFYNAGKEGFSNTYYAAAVQSMLTSFHNFFFASFDAGGYVSVDKPPLGLWIQALSAAMLGFHGWSLILPQAVAAVISTALIYHLVQRTFGKPAGLVAALAYSLTPIAVAVSRTNNFDAVVVLLLLLGAWAVLVAAEKGSPKLLLVSVALVGLGFNVKMLQAFMVLPAFYLVYLLSPANKMSKKLAHLCMATMVLLVISFSWAVAVDMTPASDRPYVGSSQTNSVIELAFGYNGIQRVLPGGSPMGAAVPGGAGMRDGEGLPEMLPGGPENLPGGMPAMPSGFMGPGGEGGSAGIFRLFNQQMAGQISWLLPLAILGFTAALLVLRKEDNYCKKLLSLCLWGMWMLPMLVYFSIAGFFHRYYLIMLAPAITALCGIGITTMWYEYKNRGRRWYLLPASFLVTAAAESFIVSRYPAWSFWLVPAICGACLVPAAVLAYAYYDDKNPLKRLSKPAVVCGVAALLVAPALWSLTPLIYHSEAQIPYAGPELAKTGMMDMGHGMGLTDSPGLKGFLLNNTKNEKFLVAVPNAMAATGLILDTGKPVMAVGGFIGSDPILTADKLAGMVADGELRYYLMMDMPGPSQFPSIGNNSTAAIPHFGGMMGNSQVTDWVKAHGKPVPESEWNGGQAASPANAMGFGPGRGTFELYDLKG